jgi:hypothetical protein
MNQRFPVAERHASARHRSIGEKVQLLDPRNPSREFLRQEIESNRKSERWLVLNGAIALVLVAGLVVIRQLFFA